MPPLVSKCIGSPKIPVRTPVCFRLHAFLLVFFLDLDTSGPSRGSNLSWLFTWWFFFGAFPSSKKCQCAALIIPSFFWWPDPEGLFKVFFFVKPKTGDLGSSISFHSFLPPQRFSTFWVPSLGVLFLEGLEIWPPLMSPLSRLSIIPQYFPPQKLCSVLVLAGWASGVTMNPSQ